MSNDDGARAARYVADIRAALPVVEAAERGDRVAVDDGVAAAVADALQAAAVIRGMAELVRFALSQDALRDPGARLEVLRMMLLECQLADAG